MTLLSRLEARATNVLVTTDSNQRVQHPKGLTRDSCYIKIKKEKVLYMFTGSLGLHVLCPENAQRSAIEWPVLLNEPILIVCNAKPTMGVLCSLTVGRDKINQRRPIGSTVNQRSRSLIEKGKSSSCWTVSLTVLLVPVPILNKAHVLAVKTKSISDDMTVIRVGTASCWRETVVIGINFTSQIQPVRPTPRYAGIGWGTRTLPSSPRFWLRQSKLKL